MRSRWKRDGADILDIGGESTRPGAEWLAADEELRRVIPVLNMLRGRLKIPISIDTNKSEVAEAAAEAGAEIINDVTALQRAIHASPKLPGAASCPSS